MADLQQESEVVGYACEFVEAIPEELQTDCSICLHVLRDPHMVDCCGYRFCNLCIKSVINRLSKCPLCNHWNPTAIVDKQLSRTLRQKKVKCSHNRNGCEWVGELSMLDDHLDIAQRVDSCKFYNKLRCTYCNLLLKKSQIEEHESNCLNKPIVCEYCNKFQCLRHELVQHWEECGLYPITCQKGCGTTVTRLGLSLHFEESCPFTLVDCEFAHAGCEMRVSRKDMRDHMEQSMDDHLTMLAKKYSKLEIVYETEKTRNEELELDLKDAQIKTDFESTKRENEVTILKKLCHLRAEEGFNEPNDQVIVENIPPMSTEQMIRSIFGQHGRLHHVMFYSSHLIAVVEYHSNDSIERLFHKYNTTGIKLRGYQLKCLRLGY